ncbi:Morn repeat protein [Pandoravirus inopinatum]|uniref:Morn repeat protein n=1 Tax=Pandoravirus inopinatum TaxID=1605721 RepID=A0A0B5J5P5_9VIRU|nr:Morn repeat protein [Pandoravirus inopinatum]AJF97000.1 Morn repeat protein [Pandoravirus inopinatum]
MAESDCPEREGASKNNAQPASDDAEAAKRWVCMEDASPFDCVPEEIALAITRALGDDPASLFWWALTCKRHYLLAMDATVWRGMCETRFGPPLHQRFLDADKDWRWLYKAQARIADAASSDLQVGAATIDLDWHRRVYWGDLVGGKPDGYGLALAIPRGSTRPPTRNRDDNGADPPSRYEGHWKDGKRHGYGVNVTRGGETYDGYWQEDEYHGHGICRWVDGSVYEGEWKDGERHGCGLHIYASGDSYRGEWEHGRCHGRGVYDSGDGFVYDGLWQEGKQHGHGSAQYANGNRYEGDWARNDRHGYGSYLRPDGSRYDGQWENSLPHGYGEEAAPQGRAYRGLYRAGKKHGYGVGIGDGLAEYDGQWADDYASGYGMARCPDGRTYHGWWANGVRCGYGVQRWADGTECAGVFRDRQPCDGNGNTPGRPDGEQVASIECDSDTLHMVVTRPDGFRYEGGWTPSLGSTGHGTCVYPDGSCIVGTWSGKVPLDGEITSHGTGDAMSCETSAPCTACKVMAQRP